MIKKIITLLTLTVIVGCSSSQVTSPMHKDNALGQQELKIAVLPFTNYTGNANAGEIIATMFTAELQKADTLKVREEISNDNKRYNMTQIHKTGYPEKVAKALGVDAVLYGSVSEYGYKLSLREEAAVSVSARLVSKDGTLLWSLSSSDQESFWFRSTIGIVAQNLVSEMSHYLIDATNNKQ